MTEAKNIRHWQTLSLRHAEAMMTWLAAIGFTEHATYRDDVDPTQVVHAEWLWPGGGGIMFGSARAGSGVLDGAGSSAAYLVTEDPAALFDAAIAAGGTVVMPLEDKGYGGRGGTVRDPEGNSWSLGDYQPS